MSLFTGDSVSFGKNLALMSASEKLYIFPQQLLLVRYNLHVPFIRLATTALL